ncbi:hypothetical protein FSP39_001566 [Pinctada imbricata]|uniref:Calpain catalytic domain-containing protein n=1 Tax=Pinctada imbricata TaxID=66713 RepID=A0AA88XEC9_PINIB|nr:hypothetical protein FSP39_001566 [Pinctada imbricata]
MGSGQSKSTKPQRSKSEAQLRYTAKTHAPLKKTISEINESALESKSEKKFPEDPKVSFPEANYEDGQLGISTQDKINKYLDTLNEDDLYTDPDFPADAYALFYSNKDASLFKWKRPTIVPIDQPLCGDGYRGIVHFRFWRFGDWVDVFIDDLLPTVGGKLIYGRCTESTEFWVALLEKAYAKLHGSYEAIEGGHAMDALVDLTGGIPRRYDIQDRDPQLYRMIAKAQQTGAFITCSRKGDWKLSTRADPNGLVSGHAYTITEVRKIKHERGEDKLVRIRNPWGDNNEWKGSWSDCDVNWTWVDEETKRSLGHQAKDDGEFWMSYRDFCKQFQEVTICQYGPDFDGDGIVDSIGCYACVKGSWEAGISAGGSRNNLEKFASNPQYLLSLTEPDDFDPYKDDPESEGMCSIVISLMQEHRQSKRNVKVKKLQIGFFLYKTKDPDHKLTTQYLRYNYDCGKSGIYINYREVSERFELEPGHYVLIPSTFRADSTASFMLRVYGEKQFTLTGLVILIL